VWRPRPLARCKDAFVPRRFHNSSLHPPLSPSLSYTAVVPQVSVSSAFHCQTSGLYRKIRRGWREKCLVATASSYSLPSRQHCLIDRHDRRSAFDNGANEVPGFPGPRRLVHATALNAVPPLPSNLPERKYPTSLRLHRGLTMLHRH
jgi:hypothetical protein